MRAAGSGVPAKAMTTSQDVTGSSRRSSSRVLLRAARLRESGWRKRILEQFLTPAVRYTARELLLELLKRGENIHPPTLYRVLRDLNHCGLLDREQDGPVTVYFIRDDRQGDTGTLSEP